MENKEEVFRFRPIDLAQYFPNEDTVLMWHILGGGGMCMSSPDEKDKKMATYDKMEAIVTPKQLILKDRQGNVIDKFSCCFFVYCYLPPHLRMMAACGLCYEEGDPEW